LLGFVSFIAILHNRKMFDVPTYVKI